MDGAGKTPLFLLLLDTCFVWCGVEGTYLRESDARGASSSSSSPAVCGVGGSNLLGLKRACQQKQVRKLD